MAKVIITEKQLIDLRKLIVNEIKISKPVSVNLNPDNFFSGEEFSELLKKTSYDKKFINFLNKQYDKVIIHGSLDLRGTPITSLPDNLRVGSLFLQETPIQSLGDNLYVGRYLNLAECKNLQSLPDNLYVGGELNLNGTPIKSLPDNLYVGGDLRLNNTQIQSLPDNLYVPDAIFIYGTPLNQNDELVAKYEEEYIIVRHNVI